MGKQDVDRKVAEAIKALTLGKEASIRDLAEALDKIPGLDAKLIKANEARTAAIAQARDSFEAAKTAGWKVSELRSAGFTVPAPITLGIEDAAGHGTP